METCTAVCTGFTFRRSDGSRSFLRNDEDLKTRGPGIIITLLLENVDRFPMLYDENC